MFKYNQLLRFLTRPLKHAPQALELFCGEKFLVTMHIIVPIRILDRVSKLTGVFDKAPTRV